MSVGIVASLMPLAVQTAGALDAPVTGSCRICESTPTTVGGPAEALNPAVLAPGVTDHVGVVVNSRFWAVLLSKARHTYPGADSVGLGVTTVWTRSPMP